MVSLPDAVRVLWHNASGGASEATFGDGAADVPVTDVGYRGRGGALGGEGALLSTETRHHVGTAPRTAQGSGP